jgi:micrococcal nuclease
VTAIIDLGLGVSIKRKLRLYGINTPELRGEEREQGIISRNWLRSRLNSCEQVYIQTIKDKNGKYGRLLAVLYVDNNPVSINEEMINKKLAKQYLP